MLRIRHLWAECPPVKITGRDAHALRHRLDTVDRALLAIRAEKGGLALHRLTRAQSTQLFDVGFSSVTRVSRLSEEERLSLINGSISLGEIEAQRRNERAIVSDTEIDRFLARAGAERIMHAIDKLTAPQAQVQAAE